MRVIRDMFSESVSEVLVDQKQDYEEILGYLKTIAPTFRKRVKQYRDATPLFDAYNIEKDIERSLRRKVWLKSGGYLIFDHGEALLAIDVNTGRHIGKSSLEDTIYKTNMEAVPEICRQLRLRDIGGLIVVDLIDMKRMQNQKRVENEMRKRLREDPTATSCTGLSKFGLIEITRKRVRPELQELFTDVCHACNGLGRVFSPATVTTRIDRWLGRQKHKANAAFTLALHPSVAAYLRKDDNEIIKRLERQHKATLQIAEDPELDQDEYEVQAQAR
jgi:ribonuclease G